MSKQVEVVTKTVATRITEAMDEAIQEILMTNAHINTSDYLRDLIRKDLERRKIA